MSRLQVCEVVKTLNVGGAEVLLAERLCRAPKAGKDYTVVCLHASTAELIDRMRAAGITVVALARRPGPLGYLRLVRTVRRLAPEILNVHSPFVAAVLRPAVRLGPHRPLVVSTVHNVAFRRVTMILDRLTRGWDDQTVAVSPVVSRAPTVRGARHVVTRVHGVDVAEQRRWAARADAVRHEFAVPDGAFLAVCVANLRPQKNHMMLLDAAGRVLARRPDAMFLLAGDGPLREAVARAAERRGLAERVRVLGPVPRANRLAAAADALVLSSDHEGLPVAVMEALAAGVPVVSTGVGGVPDLVTPGVNGILTEPGSAAALADGLLRAMDPDVYRRLRAGALAGATALDMAETAVWFEDLYDRLAARGTVGARG